VDLSVGTQRHETAIGSDRPSRHDAPRLRVGPDVQRLNQGCDDDVHARVGDAPDAAIHAIQADRTSTQRSFAYQIQSGVAWRNIDRFDVMRAIGITQAQDRRRSRGPERVSRAFRWWRFWDRIDGHERPELQVVPGIREIDARRGPWHEGKGAGTQRDVLPVD